MLNNSRSSSDSFDSTDHLLVLIIFICKKTLSSFPLDAERKKRSWTNASVFDHSEAVHVGA